jgi:hypothetical protein
MSEFLSCANKDLTPEQLIGALLTKNEDGEIAIRTMLVDACEENAIDCTTNALPIKTLLAKAIGVNDCSKPALRLGVTPSALAAHLGVPTYDNLTAANVALTAGAIFYNTALTKLDVATA